MSMGYPSFYMYIYLDPYSYFFYSKTSSTLRLVSQIWRCSGAHPAMPVPPTMASVGLVSSSTSFTPNQLPGIMELWVWVGAYQTCHNATPHNWRIQIGVFDSLSHEERDSRYHHKSNWKSPTASESESHAIHSRSGVAAPIPYLICLSHKNNTCISHI